MQSGTGRPVKVVDKPGKARIRKGTREARSVFITPDSPEILPFVNRIICGDAKEVLSRLPDESVDMVITSPPYNFGHAYAQDSHDDTRDWNDYFARLRGIWVECVRW